ncbi:MAG: DUF4832 domain-containing protein [Verrucomicrobia bacterium]|nr:DUF4832 domain-containing protein [Verrucomicrobiota bacterium]
MKWLPLLLFVTSATAAPLEYAAAPPDNPLKGFVPYAGQAKEFPHSLEFQYFPLKDLMTGPSTFDWQPLERLIAGVSARGCQTVFRVYLEYVGKPCAVPQFLLDDGVKVTEWMTDNTYRGRSFTPDYADPRLRTAMTNFIGALGARYDGDPRVGFITAGLLGSWGEWHTHPRRDLWASKTVQAEVMDAYEAAFKKTPVLLRYPTGDGDRDYAPNHTRRFGYHDDSFAWATMPTGKPGAGWFFMARMNRAGPQALEKWRTQPIGGEVRPETWLGLWDVPSSTPTGQEFLRCVEATHATWLMDSSIARKLTPEQRDRAIAGARRLGYEFHIADAEVKASDGELLVHATVVNKGVAPFYADWPVELGAMDSAGRVTKTWRPDWKLNALLPEESRMWSFCADLRPLDAGTYRLLLRTPNPMAAGRPLCFANRDPDRSGWVMLGGFAKK